jgi:hypothetical protein
MIKNANTDLMAGIFGLIITGVFWFSIDPDISHLSIMFPKAMVIIMGIIAAALVVKGLIKTRAQHSDMFAEGSNQRWIITGILFFVWVVAVAYIGFWVSSVVGISVIVYYLARAVQRPSLVRVLSWVAIIIGEVTFFYLIFTKLLDVPLPADLLF